MNRDEDLQFIASGITESYKAGMASERLFFTDMLAPIFAAFDRAQHDPHAKIPSALTAAIVAARARFVTVTPAALEKQRA